MTEAALRRRLPREELLKAAKRSTDPKVRAAVRNKPKHVVAAIIARHVRQLDQQAAPIRDFVKAKEDAPLVTLT